MKRVIALMAMVAVGLGVFLYPQAAQWNSFRKDYRQNVVVDETTRLQTPSANNALLEAAQEYNQNLLRQGIQNFLESAAAYDVEYQSQLRNEELVGPALARTGVPRPDEAMARVSIPQLDISLPVYHGSTEEILSVGAGHVYGTSLPVGGEGTHAVITAHSRQGMTGRFTRIHEMKLGDEFFVTAAGQTMRYVVDDISTVLPNEVEPLRIVPGEDYATLLTCTPPGINSHRLLVRGVREDLPIASGEAPGLKPLPFPTWAVIYFGGIAAAGGFAAYVNKATKPKLTTAQPSSETKTTTTANQIQKRVAKNPEKTSRPAGKGANSPKSASLAGRPTGAPKSIAAPRSAKAPQPQKRVAEQQPRGRHVAPKGCRS